VVDLAAEDLAFGVGGEQEIAFDEKPFERPFGGRLRVVCGGWIIKDGLAAP